jgi:hypothetical protein
MNSQNEETSRKAEAADKMKSFYVDGDSIGRRLLIQDFSFDLVSSNATTNCTDAQPPAFMGAADVTFFNENYKALREAFVNLALMWKDLSTRGTRGEGIKMSSAEGVKKYQELEALMNRYEEVRSTLSNRTKVIQNQLFPYSVAKSPYKEYYIYLHDDLNKVKDFAATIPSYEYMMENKDLITAGLDQLEKEITPHLLKVADVRKIDKDDALRNGYGSFYQTITSYIGAAKELMNNSNDRITDIYLSNYKNELSDLTKRYNYIMQ